MDTNRWLTNVGHTLRANSPHILSGVAIAGVVGTAVLAVRATPLAMDTIDKHEAGEDPLPAIEKFKLVWKFYIPAGLTGVATIFCILASDKIGTNRQAATIAAYTLVNRAFTEYRDQVEQELGKTKARKIDDEVQEKRISEKPVSTSQIIYTGKGEHLVFESLTGRYFESDIEAIRKAANDVNASIIAGDMYAPLNDFFGLLGLERTVVGDELGWNLENLMDLTFSSHLADDGRPTLAIGYAKLPIREYTQF